MGNGDLSSIAWSADGSLLIAAGRWWSDGKFSARRWRTGDWVRQPDVPVAYNTVMDFAPLSGGGWLFAAGDPTWGVLDATGMIRLRHDAVIADLRGPDRLRISRDARQVRFVDRWSEGNIRSFDVASRSLGGEVATLQPPRTTGVAIAKWEDDRPTLDAKPIDLVPHEVSFSLAIAPDGQHFALGSDRFLRHFERNGKPVWSQPVPGIAWAVNWSADGRFIVAAYGDGTIRWHRAGNGSEVLALFVHADGKRWIAWTPQGFYASSGPDAEELFGYHLNRGRDREGEFVSARQLREHADAKAIGDVFAQQGVRLYGKDKVKVRVLPDSQASGDAIRAALMQAAAEVSPHDVFVLYLAGHGASLDREYHFIPYDAVYASSAALRQRSLTHEDLRQLLQKVPATQSVVLLDTCAAGGFGRQDGREIGQKDAIDRLSRLTGRAMIAATADDKMALEGEGGHGAFTYALLDGLRGKADRNGNGTVEVRELADHVEDLLPKITRKWGYEQFPFSSTEGQSFTLLPRP